MVMPSKGARTPITVRVPEQVAEELESRRRAAGVSSVSQYISDVLAATTGYNHRVRELTEGQGVLPISA